MLIALPIPERPAGRKPWLSAALLALVLLLAVAEALILHLPSWAQLAVSKLAWLRLYTAPDEARALFHPWQLWSQALLPSSWAGLILGGYAWSWLAPAAEARLGALGLLLGLAVLVPLSGGTFLLGGVAAPELGLLSLVLAAGGLLLGAAPQTRLRGWAGWWLLTWIGSLRFAVPASAVLLGFLGLDLLRRLSAGSLLADPSPRFLPIFLLGLALTVVAGQLLSRFLLPVRSQRPSTIDQ
jgi:hypothetical protein